MLYSDLDSLGGTKEQLKEQFYEKAREKIGDGYFNLWVESMERHANAVLEAKGVVYKLLIENRNMYCYLCAIEHPIQRLISDCFCQRLCSFYLNINFYCFENWGDLWGWLYYCTITH